MTPAAAQRLSKCGCLLLPRPLGPFAFCLAALRQGFLVVVTGKLPPEQLDRFLELFKPLVSVRVLFGALERPK